MLRLAIVLAGLLLVAGCGSEEDGEDSARWRLSSRDDRAHRDRLASGTGRPDAGAPGRMPRVRRSADELSAQSFAPVPGDMACTAIYGGPDVARVTGTLQGEPVDERFSLEDGCQIARWQRNRALLGPPGNAP